jgi:BolA protein|tara:strand:+ start:135 stop:395 length:261 start_codon:yes stop_codon:yes gene_type:complete
MNINELIAIVKKKLESQIEIQSINIEDKSFLHKGHKGNQENKFHLKISLKSSDLSKLSKIESNRKIYNILHEELKNEIHSLQILII